MIARVDKTRKGYLTFDEFSEIIKSTSQKLDTRKRTKVFPNQGFG